MAYEWSFLLFTRMKNAVSFLLFCLNISVLKDLTVQC